MPTGFTKYEARFPQVSYPRPVAGSHGGGNNLDAQAHSICSCRQTGVVNCYDLDLIFIDALRTD